MSEQNLPGNPMRPSDPWSDPAGGTPGRPAQGPAMPGAVPPGPMGPGGGFPVDPDATLPLTPAYGAPPPPYGTPPGGWPSDPTATQPATQPWGAPPPWAAPAAPGWQGTQTPPPGWVPPTGTPAGGVPYAAGDWDPDAGPQAGTAYGTRPPTPPTGNRRGAAGGGSGKTPPAIIIGSVIGVAAILAVAVWFLLLRPGDDTATSTPTPGATTFITPPPTATPEPDATDGAPTPEPTRFRNPTFAGLRIADAESLAARSNVQIQVTYEVTDEVDPDTVIAQDPPPGTEVLPGDVVRLTVAAPQPTVAVPDLRGFTEADAVATLVDLGLAAGVRSEAHDPETDAGLIILTDPRSGIAVARGTAIDYLVSLGAEPSPSPTPVPTELPVPELIGLTQDEAQAIADEHGLTLEIRTQTSLDEEPGSVLSQDPAPGTPLRPGETVVIVVAVRPSTVVVPEVRDLAEADAVAVLLDAGLEPGLRSEAFDAATEPGAVVRTDPRAGIAVAPGTSVDYVISLGAEPTPSPEPTLEPALVPDLVGLPLDEARSQAEDARLVLQVVEERETLDAVEGTVLEQDPAADAEVRVGHPVTVVVAVRPTSIAVPVLRDLAEDDAIAVLFDSALVPGERTERHHATVAEGSVIRSDPAAGTIVALDTFVDYVVSMGPEPTPSPEPTPAPIALPELGGLTLIDVQTYADENGLVLDIVDQETDDAPPDTILGQDPPAGSELRRGDSVRVTVARRPATVTVPALRDLLEEDAISLLVDADLEPGSRTERFHDTIQAGSIIRSTPGAGASVPRGSRVDYVVSVGPEPTPTPSPTPAPITIPAFVGGRLDDAQAFADANGLDLELTYQETTDAAPDTVLEQLPAEGGALRPGETIRLLLAAAPSTATVPDVRDQLESDAVASLIEAGLMAGTRTARFHDTVAQGAVVRTDPQEGTVVPVGSAVDYVVSRGPEPTPTPSPTLAPVVIPALVGGPVGDAQAFADANWLTLDVVPQETADAPPDTVLEQDPVAGGELRPGGSLRVTVATPPTTTTVPDVRGDAEEDAVARLIEAGLTLGDRAVRFNDTVPEGAVVRTVPAAGTVQPLGSAIDYVVSRGTAPTPSPTPEPTPAPVVIPELIGRDIAEARAFTDDSGLVLDVRELETSEAPEGTIVDQDPAPGGELAIGGTLAVSVAVAPSLVTVPELRDQSEADGIALLVEAGLAPGRRIERFHDVVPAGAIIRTDPGAASEVAPGTIVDFYVSRGPEPTPVPILAPELRGLSLEDAQATVGGMGLVLEVTEAATDQAAPGTVLDQDPLPGTELSSGATVRVDVAVAPQLVVVPTLRDLSEADGIALLTDAGLAPGRRIDRYNATVVAEAIVRTDPVAGAEVPVGTVVDYVVSRGPEPAPAPAFVGLAVDAAQAVADTNGLTLEVSEVDDDTVPTGTVLSQDPAPGEPLTGTTVRVSVARNTSLVTVPQLRGLSEPDGVALLIEARLVPGRRIDRFSPNVPAEAIVRSDPEADAQVSPGTVVDYVVSRGPEPQPVPDLQGLPIGDAEGVAGDAGLTLVVTFQETLDAEPDTVISQDPAPDAPGDGSGTVRVVVAQAPSSVLVPRVRGMAEEDALATLRGAGLRIGERSERINAEIPAGALIGTDPRAETEVAPRTRIDYTVSLGAGGGEATPEPTPEPTDEPTDEPTTDPGSGGDVTAALDSVVAQVPSIRELDQLAGIPYTTLTPRQLRRVLRDEFDATHPQLAAEEATLKRLGLLPPDADLRSLTLDLLESRVVAFYDPAAGSLAVVPREGATDAVLRFFAAGQVTKALQGQHFDPAGFTVADATQTDRINARAAVAGGDQALVMIDWAGQALSGDEQASIPGLVPTDPALLGSVPLYVRRVFEFPSTAGVGFVDALRSSGGWDAVNAAFTRPPGTTEAILHPERFRVDRAVSVALPDLTSVLGGGWSVADQRTLGELGIGIWVDDGQDGSPNAWAADGWGGDRLVRLVGPDGAWAVVWQTAWDSDTDADEFTSAADAAMADLPGAHVVLRGADLTGGAPSPSLVIVASDQGVLDAILVGTGLGG